MSHADYADRHMPVWLVPAHVLGIFLVWSTYSAVAFTLPIIVKKEFDAGHWQLLLITAAPTSLLVLSIFWGDVIKRLPLPKYLIIFWAAAMVPLVVAAAARSYTLFAVAFVASAAGTAAWPIVNGEMMKQLYPDRSRGRYLGAVVTCTVLLTAVLVWVLSSWQNRDNHAYRTYIPVICGVQLLGVLWLALILKLTGVLKRREHDSSRDTRSFVQRVLEPLSHTREVLRGDKVFARYEAAFMTYGAAWMICEALRPDLVTERLHLDYAQIGFSAFFTFQIALAASMFAAGAVMDRIGPTRLCVLIFGLYTLYPIGLALAQNETHLAASSIIYGVCSAGVNAAWLLGPVSLAPSKEKVSQYVAIHATLVGLRGTVFQFVGVGLYQITGSFTASFAIAAAAFGWASWQMWSLHRLMEQREPRTPGQQPEPAK